MDWVQGVTTCGKVVASSRLAATQLPVWPVRRLGRGLEACKLEQL
jgi:hypothetical protein